MRDRNLKVVSFGCLAGRSQCDFAEYIGPLDPYTAEPQATQEPQ